VVLVVLEHMKEVRLGIKRNNRLICFSIHKSIAMKKLFVCFVLSIICLDVWSQSKLKTQCKFGFKLGLGMHTITGGRVKTHPRIDMMGGMWMQIKISKHWTMQSELTYSQKGAGGGIIRITPIMAIIG
jgi:hypothetical protein